MGDPQDTRTVSDLNNDVVSTPISRSASSSGSLTGRRRSRDVTSSDADQDASPRSPASTNWPFSGLRSPLLDSNTFSWDSIRASNPSERVFPIRSTMPKSSPGMGGFSDSASVSSAPDYASVSAASAIASSASKVRSKPGTRAHFTPSPSLHSRSSSYFGRDAIATAEAQRHGDATIEDNDTPPAIVQAPKSSDDSETPPANPRPADNATTPPTDSQGSQRNSNDGSTATNTTTKTKPSEKDFNLDARLQQLQIESSSGNPESDQTQGKQWDASKSEASANRYDAVREQGGIGLYASAREQEMMDRAADARRRARDGQESVTHSYGEQIMTVRFEHKETAEGHMILTGREGEIAKCEDEPIHVPGAVQNWGVLMAVEYDVKVDGPIKIRQVSENSGHLLGWTPAHLFKLDCLTEALDEDEGEALREALQLAQADDTELTESGPHYFELAGTGLPGSGLDGPESTAEWVCWCSAHKPSKMQRPNLYIIEFELQDDTVNPAITTSTEQQEKGGMTSEPYEPTEEDLRESTVSSSKPIRTARRRKRRNSVSSAGSSQSGQGAGLDIFHTLNQVQDQLSRAEDLPSFLKMVVGIIKDLTSYHRVMIYQFDESWNGQVVAELVDWSKTRDLYRGLHFPATDIPAQAREMYKVNRVRLLYDRDQPTARMVCSSRSELEVPLDMTHVATRAMSPIHVKYLANMGVRASGSVSITAFGNLWGLISCHTYGPYGMRITSPQRQLCRILGNDISRNIERLSYAQRLQSRKLINTVSTDANPSGYIVAKAEDLLTLFDAEFGILSIGDEAKLLGAIENSQEALLVLEYLRIKRFTSIQVTQNIAADYPDLQNPGGFRVVAGFLSIPLTSTGRDFIAFFRRGQIKHIHWAGNPYDKILKEEAKTRKALEPRTSFKLWSETIMGKCKVWTDEQLETASVLCLVYGKFIDVWRQKETALKSNQMTSLLLSNASHEVRTPLNAIVNYLEMALDGPLDGETRDALRKSYTASKALIHVVNDLLDLTRAEEGGALFVQDPFHITSTIVEAVEIHRDEAERRKVEFDIVCTSKSPPSVIVGDRARFKQVLSNLASNAVRHTQKGSVILEWGVSDDHSDTSLVKAGDDQIVMAFVVADTGCGIPAAQLDEIFRQLEQVDTFEAPAVARSGQSAPLGLGLAVVARIVRNLGGQLRVESVEGQGSKFTVLLPCKRATDQERDGSGLRRSSSRSSVASTSGRSANSGQTSEIDSLVDAITSNPSVSMSPRIGSNTSSDGRQSTSQARRKPSLPNAEFRVGSLNVEDSNTPLKAVRMDLDDDDTAPHHSRPAFARNLSTAMRKGALVPPTPPESPSASSEGRRPSIASSGDGTPRPWKQVSPTTGQRRKSTTDVERLRVLVVEDDPINRAIIHKKLVKEGHDVQLTVHGEDAVRAFESEKTYDVVLMDLQMPICDGYLATRKIRAIEEKADPARLSSRPQSHKLLGHIPIIAVSASLHERQVTELVETGMDGWLLKPINFERMRVILAGVTDAEERKQESYQPGYFQKGGWL